MVFDHDAMIRLRSLPPENCITTQLHLHTIDVFLLLLLLALSPQQSMPLVRVPVPSEFELALNVLDRRELFV